MGLRIRHCHELWCRPAAAVAIQPLAWELPYATSASLKRQTDRKKERKERNKAGGTQGGAGTTNDTGIKPGETTCALAGFRQGLRWPLTSVPSTLSDISVLKLKVDKCSRQDTIFMKKVSKRDLKTR